MLLHEFEWNTVILFFLVSNLVELVVIGYLKAKNENLKRVVRAYRRGRVEIRRAKRVDPKTGELVEVRDDNV